MIDETFLTTEEVLEYLQVNLRTVYRLIKAGKIPDSLTDDRYFNIRTVKKLNLK